MDNDKAGQSILSYYENMIYKAFIYLVCMFSVCIVIIFSYAIIFGKNYSQCDSPDLNEKEIFDLQIKVQDTKDIKAAWQLYRYYINRRHDIISADSWLYYAVKAHDAEAELAYANNLINLDFIKPPDGDRKAVCEAILQDASKSYPEAFYTLGNAFASGVLTPREKARIYYQMGADRGSWFCWGELAKDLHAGKWGSKDDIMAYYWISLETRCTDPRSVDGKQECLLRNEIAEDLSLSQLVTDWNKVDAYINSIEKGEIIISPPRFGRDQTKSEIVEESIKASDNWEVEHREYWKRRKQ